MGLITKSDMLPTQNDLLQVTKAVRSQFLNYFVDVGSPDILQVAGDPFITAYTEGMPFRVLKTGSKNQTVTPTFNAGGGARPIVRADGTSLRVGDLAANMLMTLCYDGSNFRLISAGVAASDQDVIQVIAEYTAFPLRVIFYPRGTYTFIVPTRVAKVRASVWGGGASGSAGIAGVAGGAGGGAGGFSMKTCTVTPGQHITVTVGGGGSAVPVGVYAAGNGGGTSSFGSFCSASGGGVGGAAVNWDHPGQPTGFGGIGVGGDVNLRSGGGSAGSGGLNQLYSVGATDATAFGGLGGQAAWGGGAAGAMSTGSPGDGLPPGGGGAGGGGNSGTSPPTGAGADGMVIVEYVSIPLNP